MGSAVRGSRQQLDLQTESQRAVRCPQSRHKVQTASCLHSSDDNTKYQFSSNNPANWTIFIATTDETKNFLSRSESKIFSHKIEFLLIIGFPVEVENQDQVGKSSIFYYSTCQSSQQPLWQNGNICKHSPLKSYSDCTIPQWEDTDIICQLLQLKYNFISSCPLSVLL